MSQSGKVDINATVNAWASIVIEKWRAKIVEMQVWETGTLYDSVKLLEELLSNAGTSPDKIEFSFKLYGLYRDLGVGKGMAGNEGDLGYSPGRERKEWYSNVYFAQVMRLREILQEKYSQAAAYNIMNTMSAPFDQRYGNIMKAKSVGSLRSVVYRGKQNARNARNYANRRSQGGRWTNDHKTWKPY